MVVENTNEVYKIQTVWFVLQCGTCMNTDHKKQEKKMLATAPGGHYAVRYIVNLIFFENVYNFSLKCEGH